MPELYLHCYIRKQKQYSALISVEINTFWRLSGFRTKVKRICEGNQILLTCVSGGL